MDIDYKTNSNKSKELKDNNKNEEHKVQKVITGKVITKKKGTIQKITDEFVSEDVNNIKSYVLGEVLIPSIKKAISDIVTNGIDMILYGSTGNKSNRYNADKVSYRSYSSYSNNGNNRIDNRRPINSYSYDDIILDSRGEAEEVLSRMDELIASYGLVRVADLYDLVGITGNYTDNMYGWTNIRNARVERVRDGYMIKMPRAIPID